MQEEGWVVCRVFKKRMSTMRKVGEYESPCWYEDQASFMQDLESPRRNNNNPYYACKQELELQYNIHEAFLQLPQLESPKFAHQQSSSSSPTIPNNIYTTNINAYDHHHHSHSNNINVNGFCTTMHSQIYGNIIVNDHQSGVVDQVTDWRVLDKFVASQLSQEDQHAPNKQAASANYNSNMPLEHQYASTPTTTNNMPH